ncbi:MAG: NAD(P)-dependent oxidoreductase [Planktomarina sp.]|nr:NAD(P)-dependent oxidoreductase [Planktomarina sp.]|tara:strand:- start:2331 stop:3200 length:870 start_codon:yes stop_codon:yes gene_type:complete
MKVGIIGLGIMGSAYAKNLLDAGISVIGADPETLGREQLSNIGGISHLAIGKWIKDCNIVIISVASTEALATVAKALAEVLEPGQIVMETGTFAMIDKLAAKASIEVGGAILLDTPVSGTGKQAATADLVIMASGEIQAIALAKPYMEHLSHTIIEAGDFGAGSKLKYIANHAVALHNCAAAETLHYADSLGVDRDVAYHMLSKGAGQSKMLDLRMPLMISGSYTPATAHMAMFKKDLSIISADILSQGITTPMFDAVSNLYNQSWAIVSEESDTAAIFEVYRNIDGKI